MSAIVKKRKYHTMRLPNKDSRPRLPNISDRWRFVVGGTVHPQSWGRRKALTIRHANRSSARTTKTKPQKKWSESDFSILNVLGRGKFGVVSRATYKRNSTTLFNSPMKGRPYHGQNVAIKTFSKSKLLENHRKGGTNISLLQREINIQSHINHVNILPLYGYFESSTDFNLVLEFAQVGDCYEKMSSLSRTASKKEYRTFAKTVLWQVCQAVAYLEQVSVAHRDIKPENIVVVDHTNTVKLADFGWACWFKPGQHHTTLCGTAEYLPPDLLRKSGYDASYVDRWMVGVLAVELMEGSTPFLYDVHGDETMESDVVLDNIRAFKSFRASISDSSFQDFASSFLQVQPNARMDPAVALKHKFLRAVANGAPVVPASPTVAQRRQLFECTTAK